MFADPTYTAALWPICAPLHRVLLDLAGRMPDEWLAHQRDALADDRLADLPDTIAGSVITLGVPLTGPDVTALLTAQAAINGPGQEDLINQVTVVALTAATEHGFAATGPDQRLDLLDETALALADRDDVARVARVWRTGPAPGTRLGQQVFQLGTVESGAALLVIAADGSVHLAGAVDRFVAASFDDALAALLDGDLPDPADNPYEIDPFA